MKAIVYLSLIVLLLAGCSQANNIPGDIIPRDRMETILWQLMQTDEFTTYVIVKDSIKNLDKERIKLYNQVFELNKTNKDAFKKSYQYYMNHPEMGKVMFDSIAARANRLREEAYKPKEETPTKPDTLKKSPLDTLKKTKSDTLGKSKRDTLIKSKRDLLKRNLIRHQQ
jgi:hypothetical protein